MSLSGKMVKRSREGGIWRYRFEVAGTPFRGSCETRDQGEAEAYAAAKLAEVSRLVADQKKVGRGPMSFGRACELYVAEKVPTLLSMSEGDAATQIAFMQKYIKPALLLHEIPAKDIKAMMTARAGCLRKGRGGVLQKIQPSTVNQTLELFKRILSHAHDNHDAILRHYKWKAFAASRQKREQGDMIKRAIQPAREQKILATINRNYLQVTRFALLTGLRATENLLRWDQIDWDAKVARDVKGKGRRERGRDVMLGRAAMAILQTEFDRVDRDPVYVFTIVCTKTRKVGGTDKFMIKGQRYPITYSGWNSAWDRCKEELGLHGKVRLHDWRHTFATRNAKKVNVRELQTMMAHSKVETTMGYVSAETATMRAALDSAPMPMPLMPDDGRVAPMAAPQGKRSA